MSEEQAAEGTLPPGETSERRQVEPVRPDEEEKAGVDERGSGQAENEGRDQRTGGVEEGWLGFEIGGGVGDGLWGLEWLQGWVWGLGSVVGRWVGGREK